MGLAKVIDECRAMNAFSILDLKHKSTESFTDTYLQAFSAGLCGFFLHVQFGYILSKFISKELPYDLAVPPLGTYTKDSRSAYVRDI